MKHEPSTFRNNKKFKDVGLNFLQPQNFHKFKIRLSLVILFFQDYLSIEKFDEVFEKAPIKNFHLLLGKESRRKQRRWL